ncbi:uncharacterized protein LOC115743146 isoform X2 [Rhodamnia argentea]|uniref:Uncharacterized protein LOC115743146 isoform X2 n=1 Tax=Rhodamnia argentea TaxID=178133 RepID=A0ABM3H5K6_9MYRT|nr:uncharacterized protein LOC115743146 isoform X2 [Rhodamnia argentea]
MDTAESGGSAAAVVNSLSDSFRRVPRAAIPPLLDCILASTGMPSSLLLNSLLDSFDDFSKDVIKDGENMDSEGHNYIASLVCALCHLLKKCGVTHDVLRSYVWRVFIPLMKMVHAFDCEIQNQIVDSFLEVVTEANAWRVVEVTLVPFLLKSISLSIGMSQKPGSHGVEWRTCSTHDDYNVTKLVIDDEKKLSCSGSLTLPLLCHILAQLFNAALQNAQASLKSEMNLENECHEEKFTGALLYDLCNVAEQLLLLSSEHRSCAILLLLPIIFKAFLTYSCLKISVHGDMCILSRRLFSEKIWKCCRTLFFLGYLERRDAYRVLSLYLSFSACTEKSGHGDTDGEDREFDIRGEKEFWDEMKRGLVDKEGFLRKQSLHILKIALGTNGVDQNCFGGLDKNSCDKQSDTRSLTKREQWAVKEARSLGIGKECNLSESLPDSRWKWEAFLLLYEMLEEYGTHLVEAAWNHQVSSLLHFCGSHYNSGNSGNSGNEAPGCNVVSGEFPNWLSVLWERGFSHDNPQVRCLIMESFLSIHWENYGSCAKALPQSFVLGPFMQGLNDPVHHKNFGLKGAYSSVAIEGATKFLYQYIGHLNARTQMEFLRNLSSLAKQQSFGRAGLMALSECIASAACRIVVDEKCKSESPENGSLDKDQVEHFEEDLPHSDGADILDVLRYVVESCKQHFNPNYRLQVCGKILEAAASVVYSGAVPLEMLLHFISTFPREFIDVGGPLHMKIKEWLFGSPRTVILNSLLDFPRRFINSCHSLGTAFTCDDEELAAWEYEARRWAMVLFLVANDENQLETVLMFIKTHGIDICNQSNNSNWLALKYLILLLSLILELQELQGKTAEVNSNFGIKSTPFPLDTVDPLNNRNTLEEYRKFLCFFLSILEDLVAYAKMSCSIFWSSCEVADVDLPGSVRGKLGGPSQRRLSSSITTAVLQAITSVKAVASISLWCAQMRTEASLNICFDFLWDFLRRTLSASACNSKTGAELYIAAYEALASALRTLVSAFSPLILNIIWRKDLTHVPLSEEEQLLDSLVITFLHKINTILGLGFLTRTRRAVLINWKWRCLESLLSMPYHACKDGVQVKGREFFFSDDVLGQILVDLVGSLENAAEDSVLPMLRSLRLVLGLFASSRLDSAVSPSVGVDTQMMWQLVRSSWVLHVSCKKRRVAAISALLSSVLHPSLFKDESMHVTESGCGPLKWFVEMVLEEGTKSPRTIRLAALHLTGVWLSNPTTLKYYIKELKLLSLHGSVAFDEDFESEMTDNNDAKLEVSLLANSPDAELTEAFINTELYARVSVAALFCKLADLAEKVGSTEANADCRAALDAGKLFLLELLDAVVNEKDLAKELYKKYSAIHRRKIRAWQMICALTRFVSLDIVGQVTGSLHICLYRNNLPAVRQYLETFAINVYLKFPSLVRKQLVPILRDHNARPQALSSYVFIAANILLHAFNDVQLRHLEDLLPPIIPLLTSHHHSLRGFTQLLVYKVLQKLFPAAGRGASECVPLEKKCFEDLQEYLTNNHDCARLRSSMEGYLDAYDPKVSATPSGIFVNRVEELEFECVPMSLMEQVLDFLNDVRGDLRCSMAKDLVAIKNESLRIDEDSNHQEVSSSTNNDFFLGQPPGDALTNFQKKFTLAKHDKQDALVSSFLCLDETNKLLSEMEQEDHLVNYMFPTRIETMDKNRASRQNIILVASLLDRIPNLAGLARTCEVFKASGLAIADANITRDKQFQLISVTAEKWVPIIEVPVRSLKGFLDKKKREGFSVVGLEQTANSVPLDQYAFPTNTVLVLGREKEGIPVDIIHILDACIEIPQLGVVRSLNVHVSGAIALWEYTRQQRSK